MSRNRPTRSERTHSDQRGSSPMRLQRVLAQAGFGSRRECEQLIAEGRVEVDGQIVTELGTRADPSAQKIFVDGVRVRRQSHQYFVVNKPSGVLSTSSDPAGRVRVIDLIKTGERVYTVGRLDKSSEGLILVTNDGDLANWLTHPRYGVTKTYHVRVAGSPSGEDLQRLRRGVRLAEGIARINKISVRRRQKNSTDLEIILDEGRNREIRRVLARTGHKVLKLRRVAIGPIRLAKLPLGAHRRLTARELQSLRNLMRKQGKPVAKVRRKRTAKATRYRQPSGKTTGDSKAKGKRTGRRTGLDESKGIDRRKRRSAKRNRR